MEFSIRLVKCNKKQESGYAVFLFYCFGNVLDIDICRYFMLFKIQRVFACAL